MDFPAGRGLSRRGTKEGKERVSLLSLIFASETSASREHMEGTPNAKKVM